MLDQRLRLPYLVAFLLFAALWFFGSSSRHLVHPDEGRYAEIAREMVVGGDWITPRLDGLKYLEKPPLQYWITAMAYRAFGVAEWTARLWSMLAGFLTLGVVYVAGAKLAGRRAGVLAASILAGSTWWMLNAHFNSLDTGLSFFSTVALGGFLCAQNAKANDTLSSAIGRRWMIAAWIGVAGAVLSKGLIGLALPGGALVIYSFMQRDLALWRRIHWVLGIAIVLALCTPWFVLVARDNGEFLRFFFIHEHVERFLTTEHRRTGALWYFVPILLIGLAPWTVLFLSRLSHLWTDSPADGNGFRWGRFTSLYAAVIFVFFSASGSKLPSYILPLFPPLALLLGWQLTLVTPRLAFYAMAPLVLFACALFAVSLFGADAIMTRFESDRLPLSLIEAALPWLRAATLVAAAGGGLGLFCYFRGRIVDGTAVIAFASVAACVLVTWAHDALQVNSSASLLASVQAPRPLNPAVPFYSIRMYDQTVPFYLQRTLTVVDHPDELALGLASEPEKGIASVPEWKALWRQSRVGYAIMQPDDYEAFKRAGLPMRELGRDPRRVIVSRQ